MAPSAVKRLGKQETLGYVFPLISGIPLASDDLNRNLLRIHRPLRNFMRDTG
jgi:hypothetical protein